MRRDLKELPTGLSQGGLKVSSDFNLRSFIERNKLSEIIFKRREQAISEFHRKNMMRKLYAPEDSVYASLGLPPPLAADMHIKSDRNRPKIETQSQLEHGLKNGMISIEQAYTLIQRISNTSGRPLMSDSDIGEYLKAKQIEPKPESIKKFKWREVLKFMKMNPHVLMQLLNLNSD